MVPSSRLYAPCLIFSKSRNLSLSLVAGNATIWKPSPTTPLCAIATTRIVADVLEKNGLSGAIASLAVGGQDVGEAIVESPDVPLGKYAFACACMGVDGVAVSFTGSERVGRIVGKNVMSRFGKTILELGGNSTGLSFRISLV